MGSAAEQIEKAEAEGLNGVQQGEGEGPPETSLPFSMLQVKAVAGTDKKVDAALDIAPVAKNATSDLEQQNGGFGKVFQETAPAEINRTIEGADVSAAEQIEKAEAEGLTGVQQGEGEGPPDTSLPFSMLQVKAIAGTYKKVDAALDTAPVAKNATSDLEQQNGGFGKVFQETAPAEFNRTIEEANVS